MASQLMRHNILLYPGEFAMLEKFHPAESPTSIVRRLVHDHIKRMQQLGEPQEAKELREFV